MEFNTLVPISLLSGDLLEYSFAFSGIKACELGRRVCKQWKSIIDESDRIWKMVAQQALTFCPNSIPEESTWKNFVQTYACHHIFTKQPNSAMTAYTKDSIFKSILVRDHIFNIGLNKIELLHLKKKPFRDIQSLSFDLAEWQGKVFFRSIDNRISLFNPSDHSILPCFPTHQDFLLASKIHGKNLIVASSEGFIDVWDIEKKSIDSWDTEKPTATFKVFTLASAKTLDNHQIHADGPLFAYVQLKYCSTIVFYDLESKKKIWELDTKATIYQIGLKKDFLFILQRRPQENPQLQVWDVRNQNKISSIDFGSIQNPDTIGHSKILFISKYILGKDCIVVADKHIHIYDFNLKEILTCQSSEFENVCEIVIKEHFIIASYMDNRLYDIEAKNEEKKSNKSKKSLQTVFKANLFNTKHHYLYSTQHRYFINKFHKMQIKIYDLYSRKVVNTLQSFKIYENCGSDLQCTENKIMKRYGEKIKIWDFKSHVKNF
jgi:hypothetical protein